MENRSTELWEKRCSGFRLARNVIAPLSAQHVPPVSTHKRTQNTTLSGYVPYRTYRIFHRKSCSTVRREKKAPQWAQRWLRGQGRFGRQR
jgi:hypothetical protein